ncbi:pilus assembly protein TadG-related protein [Demequina lutea]|uniref:Secretion/DNA translocation related TadE-like protein n=1 Tax=Demequina lutea TaxID=431489 RepID=A0A7Y9ZBG7_9MICO|nr:pilus assembly protein TadG-related protein [Demequina lutea]NYI40286.1 secretion/DNA translocation related TadE-like protein [Demequina lutea]
MRARSAVLECERGSATPLVVAVLAMIAIVGLSAVDGGAVMVASAKTESVADLAVLAAARVDRDSRAEGASAGSALQAGCEAAREVASRNGMAVSSCVRGPRASVLVTVELRVRAWPGPLRASARAGPSWG